MKKIKIFKIFSVIIICMSIVLPAFPVSAKTFDTYKKTLQYEPKKEVHEHDFSKYDVCTCGDSVVHDFSSSLLFRTSEKVTLREKPSKKSNLTDIFVEENNLVKITGITRNRANNLWLKANTEKGEGYIFAENLQYAYDENMVVFAQEILTGNSSNEEKFLAFVDMVKPGGVADIKVFLDPSSKGNLYTVQFNNGNTRELTAEEIGNCNYGTLGYLLGFTEEELLYGGGLVNIGTTMINIDHILEPVSYDNIRQLCDIIVDCGGSYCDNPEDVSSIQMGIDYAKRLAEK